jgi:hypothetical protein
VVFRAIGLFDLGGRGDRVLSAAGVVFPRVTLGESVRLKENNQIHRRHHNRNAQDQAMAAMLAKGSLTMGVVCELACLGGRRVLVEVTELAVVRACGCPVETTGDGLVGVDCIKVPLDQA